MMQRNAWSSAEKEGGKKCNVWLQNTVHAKLNVFKLGE